MCAAGTIRACRRSPGMRRRGYTPEAIRNFCAAIGVSKTNGIIELAMLEHFVREDLNKRAPRVMAVLRPLRVVIDNYPEGQVEELEAVNNPEDPSCRDAGRCRSRACSTSSRTTFAKMPPKKFYRLSPGQEVRLRGGYFIKCTSVVKDEKSGEVVEVHCTYDPETRSGNAPDGRKVKATIHWVSAQHAIDAEVRLYENLFTKEDPNDVPEGQEFTANLNPNSLEIVDRRQAGAVAGERQAGRSLSVRAAGILLRRSGFEAGSAGVQPHGAAARYLGEDREAGEGKVAGRSAGIGTEAYQ